jgi:hypothetical protein
MILTFISDSDIPVYNIASKMYKCCTSLLESTRTGNIKYLVVVKDSPVHLLD